MLLRTRFEELIKEQLNRIVASSLLGYLLPFSLYGRLHVTIDRSMLQPLFRLLALERGAFAYQMALLFEKVS